MKKQNMIKLIKLEKMILMHKIKYRINFKIKVDKVYLEF
jgi:hypothetical protein